MGIDLHFAHGEGPVISNPIRETKDVEALRVLDPEEATPATLDASPANVLRALRGKVTAARLAYPDVLHLEVRDILDLVYGVTAGGRGSVGAVIRALLAVTRAGGRWHPHFVEMKTVTAI
jgi:hypothetical protein